MAKKTKVIQGTGSPKKRDLINEHHFGGKKNNDVELISQLYEREDGTKCYTIAHIDENGVGKWIAIIIACFILVFIYI